MKVSQHTMSILQNFGEINPNILVRPGNKLATISPAKNLVSEASVPEMFSVEFGLFDLNRFLSVTSMFKDPDFIFGEKTLTIKSEKSSFTQNYTSPDVLTVPKKPVNMPESVINLKLTSGNLGEIFKASSVLQVPDLRLSNDDGEIIATILDKKNVSSDVYVIRGLGEIDKTITFNTLFKIENLKLLPGSYDVAIAEKMISHFKLNSTELTVQYWVAVESDSNFTKG